MIGIAFAMAVVAGGAQEAPVLHADATRAEVCAAYDALDRAAYAVRRPVRERCIELGGSGLAYFDRYRETRYNDPNAARAYLNQALELAPDEPQIVLAHGIEEAVEGGGSSPEINRAVELARAAGGSGAAFFDLYGLSAGIRGLEAHARLALDAATQVEPDNPSFLLARGTSEFGAYSLSMGVDQGQNPIPGSADIDRGLRLALASEGPPVAELSHFSVLEYLAVAERHQALADLGTRLMQSDERASEGLRIRALANLSLRQPEAALADLDRQVQEHPWENTSMDSVGSNIRLERALALVALGRGREAVADARQAQLLEPYEENLDLPRLVLCRALVEAGNAAAAVDVCAEVDDARWVDALRSAASAYRGLALERSGQSELARAEYQTAIELGDTRDVRHQQIAYLHQDGLETARAGLARLGD